MILYHKYVIFKLKLLVRFVYLFLVRNAIRTAMLYPCFPWIDESKTVKNQAVEYTTILLYNSPIRQNYYNIAQYGGMLGPTFLGDLPPTVIPLQIIRSSNHIMYYRIQIIYVSKNDNNV